MKILILITTLCLAGVACSEGSRASRSAIMALPTPVDITGYIRIHELHLNEGRMIVGIYGKPIAQGIFSELLLINELANAKLIIYLLDRDRFLGINGVEQEPDSALFYGYRMILMGPDYIVVNYLSSSGKNVSDDVTISWNKAMQRFEFEKT